MNRANTVLVQNTDMIGEQILNLRDLKKLVDNEANSDQCKHFFLEFKNKSVDYKGPKF
jgi:hypothetical protein